MAQSISETSSAVTRSAIASTLANYRPAIRDNVSDTTPLLSFLMGKLGGNARTLAGFAGDTGDGLPGTIMGGRDIMVPVQLTENQTPASYSGADPIDITNQDTDEYALFPIRQVAGSFVIIGRDMRGNKGPSQIYNLVQSKVNRLTEDMRMELNRQAVSDGTGNGGKDIMGLAGIVGTGTLANISPTTYPKWQPGGFPSGSSRHGIKTTVTFSSAGLDEMRLMMNRLTFGTDGPDGIFCSAFVWSAYADLLEGNIRYTSTDAADGSFKVLTYMGVRMFFDHAIGNVAANGFMYFLNSRHIAFQRDSQADFDWIDDGVRPANQDVFTKIMIVEGNVVTDNRRMLGVINSIT